VAFEQKPNTGSSFKNERKTTDQHPNMTGTALIDGVAYFMDTWTNVKADGSKYLSHKFKRKDKQNREPVVYISTPRPAATDDDIPF
jgi:hypothetical protein